MSEALEAPQYVRFGAVPHANRSVNFRTGEYLAGVSAYSGRLDEERGFIIDTSELTMEGGVGALITLAACDWPAYFVEGSEVGRGPDGEPLLKVEHSWCVPETTSITSIQTWSQPALKLWSDGPRDGSGASVQQWRLKDGSPYVPEFITFGVQDSPHALRARLGGSGGKHKDVDKKGRAKRQKQARKKQRSNK